MASSDVSTLRCTNWIRFQASHQGWQKEELFSKMAASRMVHGKDCVGNSSPLLHHHACQAAGPASYLPSGTKIKRTSLCDRRGRGRMGEVFKKANGRWSLIPFSFLLTVTGWWANVLQENRIFFYVYISCRTDSQWEVIFIISQLSLGKC